MARTLESRFQIPIILKYTFRAAIVVLVFAEATKASLLTINRIHIDEVTI